MMREDQQPLEHFAATGTRAAMLVVLTLAGVRGALMDTGLGNVIEFAAGVVLGAVVIGVAVVVVRAAAPLLTRIPSGQAPTLAALLLALIFLGAYTPAEIWRTLLDTEAWSWPFAMPNGIATPSVVLLVAALGALAGWLALWLGRGARSLSGMSRIAGGVAVLVLVGVAGFGVAGLISDGEDPYPSDYRTLAKPVANALDLANPGVRGAYAVQTLSYGAGENKRRPEFAATRDLESRTVDASALLAEWKGAKQRHREWYWGFGLEDAPLNGTVWEPAGVGPFPLVLIVHGNHGMEEYSDPGYAYLGELLASHGMLAVSVDQNYINGTWSGDFRGKEMPLRGWLLLEHLDLWRDWNSEAGHRFAGKVDMQNIGLVGHSRGGEALPIAYMMNQLDHYPDDATVPFDYGFSIQALVAIAQVDQRYHRRLELEDVNFLALQGSYDSDEPAFHGLRQFNRISLADDDFKFKAGVYVHGANHGQFNSIWGREDTSPPDAWLLNLAPLISASDQQQVAAVYVSAFLQTTLQGERRYLPLFHDPRRGAPWLPDLAYVNQFSDSSFVPIANFEEDLDVLTASIEGATIRTEGLVTWREEELRHRDERLQGSSAAVLGWSAAEPAVYEIAIPEAFWQARDAGAMVLSLAVSGSTEKPADDETDQEDDAGEEEPLSAPRFRIEAEDFAGRTRVVDAAEVAHLAPPLRVRYLKSETLNEAQYNDVWEPVLQYIELPLSRLLGEGDPETLQGLRYLRLRFDNATPGVLMLDDIGLRRAP